MYAVVDGGDFCSCVGVAVWTYLEKVCLEAVYVLHWATAALPVCTLTDACAFATVWQSESANRLSFYPSEVYTPLSRVSLISTGTGACAPGTCTKDILGRRLLFSAWLRKDIRAFFASSFCCWP